MIDQKKLQQLHALLLMGDEHAYVKRGDLRDLIECFIEEPATDVNAAPAGAPPGSTSTWWNGPLPGDPKPTDVDAVVERVVATLRYLDDPDEAEDLRTVLAELARLRAEAKPKPAGRVVWVIMGGGDDDFYTFAKETDARRHLYQGEVMHRAVLDESPVTP